MEKSAALKQFYNDIKTESTKRNKKLNDEINALTEKRKNILNYWEEWGPQIRDQIEHLEKAKEFLTVKQNLKALLERAEAIIKQTSEIKEKTKYQLANTLTMDEKFYRKLTTFILNSPKGLLSLTSLYDRPSAAQKMLFDFTNWFEEDLLALTQMPEFTSITSILSGKGLGIGHVNNSRTPLTLSDIQNFIEDCKSLWIDIETMGNHRKRKGLPTYEQLKNIKQQIKENPTQFLKRGQKIEKNTTKKKHKKKHKKKTQETEKIH